MPPGTAPTIVSSAGQARLQTKNIAAKNRTIPGPLGRARLAQNMQDIDEALTEMRMKPAGDMIVRTG